MLISWGLVSGQWSVVSCHWSVVGGHWSVVIGHSPPLSHSSHLPLAPSP
ncbi:hypothetical protein [Argonema antarcticum]|nr:hypothetical protein [Argonema antarcticum]MCL1470962.1 hypothetical protein [Argonema antarcticum A004/B2]